MLDLVRMKAALAIAFLILVPALADRLRPPPAAWISLALPVADGPVAHAHIR